MMDRQDVFRSVMHIGEDHVYYRGGIGAVLAIYKRYFPAFRATGSFRRVSNAGKVAYFAGNLFTLVFKLIADRKIRLVHIHGSYGASVYRKAVILFITKFLFGKKVIYHIHSSEYIDKFDRGSALYRKLSLFLLKHSDIVGCLTPLWMERFVKKFALKNAVVILNMIDPPVVNEIRRSLPANAPVKMVFLGMIDEKKGIFDLVRMLVRYKENFEGKLVLQVGGEGKTTELKQLVESGGISSMVQFMGWVNVPSKQELLSRADIFILPSHNEGLPISMLEAMSYGLPVLASRVGGIPEVMKEGYNGFMFEKQDLEGMKNALQTYLDDQALLREHGNNSLHLVEKFLPREIIPRMENLYRSLIQ